MNKKKSLSSICKELSKYPQKDLEQFFQAFLTKKEIETLEGRVALIDLLLQKIPQRSIAEELGISFSLITRGSHELKSGVGKKFFPKFFNRSEVEN